MLNKYCIGCGVKVTRLGTKRCRKCYTPYLTKLLKGRKPSINAIKSVSGSNHWNWKGGTHLNYYGYVMVRHKGKYVSQHRLNMEKYLGRKLTKQERVHHKDHIKINNEINNLMLFNTHSEHIKFEHQNGERRKN